MMFWARSELSRESYQHNKGSALHFKVNSPTCVWLQWLIDIELLRGILMKLITQVIIN